MNCIESTGLFQDEITKSQDELIFVKKLMLIGQYQTIKEVI